MPKEIITGQPEKQITMSIRLPRRRRADKVMPKSKSPKITDTINREFEINPTIGKTIKISALISDTLDGFAFALSANDGKIPKWCWSYESVITIEPEEGLIFGFATAYWKGTLPIEQPFRIIIGICLKK